MSKNNDLMAILEHHGIKGMRWGVRKRRKSGPSSQDAKTARNIRKKRASELSDKEIETYLKRVRLESQYKQATATRLDKAKAYLKKSFSKSARQATDKGVKQGTDLAVKLAMEEYVKPYMAEVAKKQKAASP